MFSAVVFSVQPCSIGPVHPGVLEWFTACFVAVLVQAMNQGTAYSSGMEHGGCIGRVRPMYRNRSLL